MNTELREERGQIGRVQSHLSLKRAVRLGEWGEWIALRHSLGLHWDIVARNWRTRKGELDLIAFDGPTLVFVEVKTRQRPCRLPPEANIDEQKKGQIEVLSYQFIQKNELFDVNIRFDLIAVEMSGWRDYRLRHYMGFM